MNASLNFEQIVELLKSVGVPYWVMGTRETGRALMVEEGARVLAMAPPGSDRNVLWGHPGVADVTERPGLNAVGAGGMGGIRLWHGPEQAYMWNGATDAETFSTYVIQKSMDPGRYAVNQVSDTRCIVQGGGTVIDYRTGGEVKFEVRRIVEIFRPKLAGQIAGVAGVGIRFQNVLRLVEGGAEARIDMWHLMQLPVPALVGAFVREGAVPEVYFNPSKAGGWVVEDGRFSWMAKGERMAKLGLATGDLAGSLFAIRECNGSADVWLWNVPNLAESEYVDFAAGSERNDQVAQYWDGFGFCEVEYHSPGVSMERPEVLDVSELVFLEIPEGQREEGARITGLPVGA